MLTQTPTTASIATTDDRDVATPHTLGWSRRGATMSTAAPAAATNFPPGTAKSEKGLRTYLADTGALSGRQVLMWWRDKSTALQTLLFPALSMVMFKVVLGDSIGRVTGQNSAFGTVPLVVLVAAMFGSLAGGVRLTVERDTGLLTRLYVLPVHRAADLSARVISELVRVLAATAVLTSLGYLIGWRFNQGFLSAVGIFAVALLYGGAFAILVLAIALVGKNLPLVPIITLVSSLFMFFNSGFSPVSAYPKFLQPIVGNQPMTCAIDTMRALATGAPLGDSLIKTVLWAVGAIVVFTIPAIKGYRRAASGR
jgi:daunorubicin resistance protein C